MKLKKIASLALAGVMAVSMLAGCKNNNGGNATTDNDTTAATSVAAAVNAGQDSHNQVKVTFTDADTKLVNAVKKAVEQYGEQATASDLETAIAQNAVLGTTTNTIASKFYGDTVRKNTAVKLTAPSTANNGAKVTYLSVSPLGDAAASDTYLKNAAANIVNELVNDLDDTTLVTQADVDNKVPGASQALVTKEGATYFDFSYTGSVYVTNVTKADGSVEYYLVTVLQQTVTQKEA